MLFQKKNDSVKLGLLTLALGQFDYVMFFSSCLLLEMTAAKLYTTTATKQVVFHLFLLMFIRERSIFGTALAALTAPF